jgi:diguanylate cyclase (GGDEF)-like protein
MTRPDTLRDQPPAARVFVAAVVLAGGALLIASTWRGSLAHPVLLSSLLLLSACANTIKIPLPVGRSVSSLSPGFAVNFGSLLVLGPGAAAWVTMAGGWAQCTFNVTVRNPWYRTFFSVSSLVLSMELGARVLAWTGGADSHAGLVVPSVAASALAYFLCNSLLVATVVALSTRRSLLRVWDQEFLWGAPNYFVGAFVAAITVRGVDAWGYGTLALLVPLFLTYRLYKVYLGRMDDERRHVRELSEMHLATVEALAMAIEAKDATAGSHVRRVQFYATELCRVLALPEDLIEGVRIAALLHDVGKLGVPDHLLAKSGPLTPEEFARVCRYPEIGAEIVSAVPFPYPVAPFIRHHHERWDGTGYPDMIAGDLIPLGARIIAIAERFDALRSERPYRPPLSPDEAVAHIVHEAGTSLDPQLVAKFVEILPGIEAKAGDADRRDPVLDNISEAQGELYELLERARAESHTDALTDLPNRRFVETHMARELARAQRTGSGLAVLAIDLNDFKIINDRLGHGAGDIVLKAVAQCLRRGLRPHDICGRHGGDEFVVVLSGAASEIADLKSLELAQAVDSLAIDVEGREALRVSVSIGAAVYPADGVTYDDLFAAADVRMYENKLRLRSEHESGHLVI